MPLKFLKKIFFRRHQSDILSPTSSYAKEKSVERQISVPPQHGEVSNERPQNARGVTIKSRRADDMTAEAQLAIFLDRYLYDRFPNKQRYSSIERLTSKSDQLKGTDVRFTMNDGQVWNIDEKAQLYYLNRNLPTFAFEIQFLRQGIPTTGWLCNKRLDTHYYLLIWPFANRDSPAGIVWSDFTKAECYMVKKEDVLAFLREKGLTVEQLLTDATRFREKGLTGKIKIEGISGVYYYISAPSKYVEEPINIVISKTNLHRIATRHYIVTPEGVECY